ncbi:MAG: GTP 3',8-cyclase MoaA [Polyangiaceae bacterium]
MKRYMAGMPAEVEPLVDALQRPLRDLRLSVTDRCNFRCRYCMPREQFEKQFKFLPRSDLLTFEEIVRLVDLLVPLGLDKIRLTGGEPLLRESLPALVAMTRERFAGVMALTTNGTRLQQLAAPLKSAGLDRVTVSLDAMDEPTFAQLTDSDTSVQEVLRGIDAAAQAGLAPIKVNCVVQRGVNEHAILQLARHFRSSGHTLRFIEYMDVGMTNGWSMQHVVSAAEILERLQAEFPLEPVSPGYRGEVASRYRYTDGTGEVGIIASVTQPFCRDCTRLRISADGRAFTCLYAGTGIDLRDALRSQDSVEVLAARVRALWAARRDRYSEERNERRYLPRVEMSYIGG